MTYQGSENNVKAALDDDKYDIAKHQFKARQKEHPAALMCLTKQWQQVLVHLWSQDLQNKP